MVTALLRDLRTKRRKGISGELWGRTVTHTNARAIDIDLQQRHETRPHLRNGERTHTHTQQLNGDWLTRGGIIRRA